MTDETPRRKPKPRRPSVSGGSGKRPSVEAHPRRILGIGAVLALVGLGLDGIGENDFATALVIAGVAALIYAIHTFGRLGPVTAERTS